MQSIKYQIEAYIKANGMRNTKERNSLIECVESMKEWDSNELFNHAAIVGITKASVYFFIKLLEKAGIVIIQKRIVFNPKNKSDENKKE